MCLLSLGELLRPTAVPLVLVYRRYQDIHPKSPLFLAVTAGQRQLAFTEGRCSPSSAWPGAVFFFLSLYSQRSFLDDATRALLDLPCFCPCPHTGLEFPGHRL